MLFTQGKSREYERMMNEKPGVERKTKKKKIFFATAENKDCPYCLYYTSKGKRCKYDKCIVFPE